MEFKTSMFLSTKNLKPLLDFIFALISALIEKIVNFFKMLEFEINTIIATHPNWTIFVVLTTICLLFLFGWFQKRREQERREQERREQERREQERREQERREQERLIKLYGETIGTFVFEKKIQIGFNKEMVVYVLGNPEHETKKITANKINERWWYGQYRGSKGAVKFTQYVDFVNGKVTGWGDN